MDADGNFVVTWLDGYIDEYIDGDTIGDFYIVVRHFNAAGVAQGGHYPVSFIVADFDDFAFFRSPSISMDSDGDYVVVWHRPDQDGSGFNIYARRYDAAGGAQGDEFRVNSITTGDQFLPNVAMDTDGGFVVTWSGPTPEGNGSGEVYARRYNAAGVAQGSEFRVNSDTTNSQIYSSAVMGPGGAFVIAWTGTDQDYNDDVYARRFQVTVPHVVGVFAPGDQQPITQNELLVQSLSSLVVGFDEELTTTGPGSVTSTANWTLIQGGVDITAQISSITFAYNAGQSRYDATLNLAAPLTAGDFILTAKGSIHGFIGVPLDGDGNATPGGDFVRNFTIDPPAAVGPEFRVNTYTMAGQFTDIGNKKVATDSAGNIVVVWQSYGQDGSGYGVYAQRYDAAGVAQGSEFQVNSTTMNQQLRAAVAMDADGAFVVTWVSFDQDGGGKGVHARRYSALGVPQGDEFLVNSHTTGDQLHPSVAMHSGGDFIVAWTSYGQDGDGYGVYAQRYNAAGGVQGGEFLVNSHTTSYQSRPTIAIDADGDFVVAWQSFEQDGSSYGIYAQRYNGAGVAQGGEFLVNTHTTSFQYYPSIAIDAGGSFIIAWASSGQDGDGTGIFAQRYSAVGVVQGDEFRVNSFTTGRQEYPSLSMDGDGDFVVTRESASHDGDGYGVYAQRYSAVGVAQGSEFQVNSTTMNDQRKSSIAMDADGDFIVAWSSLNQDGSGYGVYVQRYASNSPPTANANGPYAITEGTGVSLSAAGSSDPDGHALTYSWDINGDNVFGDATGISPTLTWAQLVALGVNDGPGTRNVRVRVDDGYFGVTTSAAAILTINNAVQTAAIVGPNFGVRGQPRVYTLSATDDSPVDQAANFTFSLDWNGDGTIDETVVGPSGTQIAHVFATAATFNVKVTAMDKDGGTSAIATKSVVVSAWALQTDPNDGSKTNLVWGGTTGIDAYAFLPGLVMKLAENNSFFAFVLPSGELIGTPQFVFVPSFNGKLIAYGQGGNDLMLADVINGPLEFYGGDGDDVLIGGRGSDFIDGGAGADIIFGGTLDSDEMDILFGGAGDDLIVGHLVGDLLNGGSGKDLLIAGSLNFGLELPNAVYAIQAEWTSNRPYEDRVANILGTGNEPRNNGDYFLIPAATVLDDASIDLVIGGDDQDWMLVDVDLDLTTGVELGEIVTDI